MEKLRPLMLYVAFYKTLSYWLHVILRKVTKISFSPEFGDVVMAKDSLVHFLLVQHS